MPLTEEQLTPELNSTYLTRMLSLSNGTKTKSIEQGESFMLTAFSIHERGGDKFIVTEIGEIKLYNHTNNKAPQK